MPRCKRKATSAATDSMSNGTALKKGRHESDVTQEEAALTDSHLGLLSVELLVQIFSRIGLEDNVLASLLICRYLYRCSNSELVWKARCVSALDCKPAHITNAKEIALTVYQTEAAICPCETQTRTHSWKRHAKYWCNWLHNFRENSIKLKYHKEMGSPAACLHKGLLRRVYLWHLANNVRPPETLNNALDQAGMTAFRIDVHSRWSVLHGLSRKREFADNRWTSLLQRMSLDPLTTDFAIRQLVATGVSPNDNPLLFHSAIVFELWRCVRRLLEAGARPFPVEGCYALTQLLLNYHKEALAEYELFQEKGRAVSSEYTKGQICMVYSARCMRGTGNLIDQLMEKAFPEESRLRMAHQALALAVLCDNPSAAKQLLSWEGVTLEKAWQDRKQWQAIYLQHLMETADDSALKTAQQYLRSDYCYLLYRWKFFEAPLSETDWNVIQSGFVGRVSPMISRMYRL